MQAMVVDDSRVTRLILGQILKGLGFEVTEASNGSQALQSLREHSRCRLALVDCNMPEMDGQAVVRAARADPVCQDLCLLMVSAEEDEKQIQQCINAGANGYLRKPFTRAQIEEKLHLLGILPSIGVGISG
jgi:two-component system chemotaxis response regulator CheY